MTGHVQGLGVRPAIFQLARRRNLGGSVRNTSRGVEIEIEGDETQVFDFLRVLPDSLPQDARVESLTTESVSPSGSSAFRIVRESAEGPLATRVPADRAVCPECLDEVNDSQDRRFAYPFTSCTACGPRYSIIRAMPYERTDTTMSEFPLCETCLCENRNRADRRFHAQTNACPECGPRVWCTDRSRRIVADGNEAIRAAAAALRRSEIVALRGLGGYQLLADATNDEAVHELRRRKGRFGKPLAVIVDSLATARSLAVLNEVECQSLTAPTNPIVLARAKPGTCLSASVHPRLDTLGLMLPTTPLHALLLKEASLPLICTSGNREGDPLECETGAAGRNLAELCDLWLHHDRPIARSIDDSVVRIIAGHPVTIRLARGLAPLTLDLQNTPPTIALGGFLKSACAFSNGVQAVLGPHVGALQTLSTRERFLEQMQDCEQLYGFGPERFVHDLHPEYFTTRWAGEQPVSGVAVQHHHAHVVSGMIESGWLDRRVLGVAWDGTGYGTDATIWGGEFLTSTAHSFERFAHLRPFRLPGGEAAIRQPWRTACSILSETVGNEAVLVLDALSISRRQRWQVVDLLRREQFAPLTTSAGRLFDAAAVVVLGIEQAEYEGQPAMCLEAVADRRAEGCYPFSVHAGEPLQLDWRPLFFSLLADRESGVDAGTMAMRFHRSLAVGIIAVCRRCPDLPVVLTGGVFQNRLLTELVVEQFPQACRELALPGNIPPNDGGLATGQLAVAAALQEKT